LYVVAYDIPDDKRRTRVHKVLSGFGRWTQFSVFECHLTDKQLVQMKSRLDRWLKPDSDSVRIYHLCQACCAKVETIGSPPPRPDKVFVV
jgi:CRISPR-associated protein Cas2